jgi:hypothetical protein
VTRLYSVSVLTLVDSSAKATAHCAVNVSMTDRAFVVMPIMDPSVNTNLVRWVMGNLNAAAIPKAHVTPSQGFVNVMKGMWEPHAQRLTLCIG